MKKEKIIIIGAGGHAGSVIDSLSDNDKYEIYGVIDNNLKPGTYFNEVKVLGNDAFLNNIIAEGINKCFVAVGNVGDISVRKRLVQNMSNLGFEFINVVDKTAIISKTTKIGKNVFIGKGVIINTNCEIDNHAIINTGSVIDHDCKIGEFSHLSPRSVLAGNVVIGYGVHIGIGTTIIQGVIVGDNSLVGAGSVVLSDLGSNQKRWGVIHEK